MHLFFTFSKNIKSMQSLKASTTKHQCRGYVVDRVQYCTSTVMYSVLDTPNTNKDVRWILHHESKQAIKQASKTQQIQDTWGRPLPRPKPHASSCMSTLTDVIQTWTNCLSATRGSSLEPRGYVTYVRHVESYTSREVQPPSAAVKCSRQVQVSTSNKSYMKSMWKT